MDRLIVMIPLVIGAIVVAFVMQRRRPDAPAQPLEHVAPAQLDRGDFDRPEAPWLVAVFTSATCDTCAAVASKVAILESPEVATSELEYSAQRDLHDRYRITAVPTVVIADADGVVRQSFLGATTATHLWAAVAELREPGSTPPGCGEH